MKRAKRTKTTEKGSAGGDNTGHREAGRELASTPATRGGQHAGRVDGCVSAHAQNLAARTDS